MMCNIDDRTVAMAQTIADAWNDVQPLWDGMEMPHNTIEDVIQQLVCAEYLKKKKDYIECAQHGKKFAQDFCDAHNIVWSDDQMWSN